MNASSSVSTLALIAVLSACEPPGVAPSPAYAPSSQRSADALTTMPRVATQEELLRATAAHDAGCSMDHVVIDLELWTHAVNSPALRFIVTACGQRMLYAEDCGASDDYANRQGYALATRYGTTWSCRYYLAARTNLGTVPSTANPPSTALETR